jgi:hypothetical protein
MPYDPKGFQTSSDPQSEKRQKQKPISVTSPSSLGEFIVDDLKLFVSPVTAVVDELRRQLKR